MESALLPWVAWYSVIFYAGWKVTKAAILSSRELFIKAGLKGNDMGRAERPEVFWKKNFKKTKVRLFLRSPNRWAWFRQLCFSSLPSSVCYYRGLKIWQSTVGRFWPLRLLRFLALSTMCLRSNGDTNYGLPWYVQTFSYFILYKKVLIQ